MARADQERVFNGIPVSAGVCLGPVVVMGRRSFQIPRYTVGESLVSAEMQRFQQALVKTQEELRSIQRELCQRVEADEGGIFDAHLLVLEDQMIIDEVNRSIAQDGINVEAAFDQVTRKFTSALSKVEDPYLRERAADMRDVADRVMANLLGGRSRDPLGGLSEPSIIIGHDLTPSQTASFSREMVLGVATDVGSPTSHTAILARSLNFPAVVGLGDVSQQIKSGQEVLIDGYNGVVIVNPSEQSRFEYGRVVQKHEDLGQELEGIRELPPETKDGVRVVLTNNIDHPGEVHDVDRFGGEGVGLFRTEYLFLNRPSLPDEDEQFESYRAAASALGSRTLTLRTLDLGADKVSKALPDFHETNPALGLRAIRYCLRHPAMFRHQLRAILRASAFGKMRLLYPMVSSLEEVREANQIFHECREELRRESIPFDESMEIGVMIETPAAAMISDVLAEEVDFFSIGTNDLIQYGSAVDRLNERVADLYQPSHPGIVRMIRETVQAANAQGIDVSVCGEMGGDPVLVPLLLGLGIRHLSVSAPRTPPVKHLIRKLTIAQTEALAGEALRAKASAELREACQSLVRQVAPELLD